MNFARRLRVFQKLRTRCEGLCRISTTKLFIPVLTGEKASGNFLIERTKLEATNVEGKVIAGSGHWLIDEAPQQAVPALITFMNAGSEPCPSASRNLNSNPSLTG